jgi:hypothetical protein
MTILSKLHFYEQNQCSVIKTNIYDKTKVIENKDIKELQLPK